MYLQTLYIQILIYMILNLQIQRSTLPDEMVFNILKTLGGSRYVWDKYLSQGKVGDAVWNAITPAYDMIQNPIQDVSALIEGKEDYRLKSIKNIPIVGSIIDNYFLGGQEKYYEQQDKKGYWWIME